MITVKGKQKVLAFVTHIFEGNCDGFVVGMSKDLSDGDWMDAGEHLYDWDTKGDLLGLVIFEAIFYAEDEEPELRNPISVWNPQNSPHIMERKVA